MFRFFVLLSISSFNLSIWRFRASARLFKPWRKVFCPSVWIYILSCFLACYYSCDLRLCYEEFFYFRRMCLILFFVIWRYLVKCCCKCLCRSVRFPLDRALIVLSNTISLYPVVFFFCCDVFFGLLTIVFCWVFRWSGFVAGWRMDCWSGVGWVGSVCGGLGGNVGCFI
jgi:hypothetical protein